MTDYLEYKIMIRENQGRKLEYLRLTIEVIEKSLLIRSYRYFSHRIQQFTGYILVTLFIFNEKGPVFHRA